MARLDRKKPNLKLIQGGKKDTDWQQVFNIGVLVLLLGIYTIVLIGR